MNKLLLGLGLGAVAVASTGCTSFRFKKAWREAEASERWEGSWKSALRGNGGALRAIVKSPQQEERKQVLDVFFEAHWHGFVTAYPVSLKQEIPRRKDQPRAVRGEHDLKSFPGGGVYHYTGDLSAGEFKVEYRSAYDTGEFVLHPAR